MPIDTKTVLSRIDELYALGTGVNAHLNSITRSTIYQGTLSLLQLVYGQECVQVKEFTLMSERHWKTFHVHPHWNLGNEVSIETSILYAALGILYSLRGEVAQGLVGSIRQEAVREVFADFINMAKQIMEDENKDAAAVLGSAALEDSLKKYCDLKGIALQERATMADIVNALKSNGLMGGAQAKIASGFTMLRNKAMHAEWDKIASPEVQSMIAFTEQFISENLSK